MNPLKLNMVGGGFQHDVCSSAHNRPQYVEWVRDGSADISIHIDNGLLKPELSRGKRRFGWILESSAIQPQLIYNLPQYAKSLSQNYELIFTHDRRLLGLSNKFRFCITNAVPLVQQKKIYEKSKLCSMITSTKMMCPGHLYRLQWAQKLSGKVDLFGTGHNPVARKDAALADYMFSVQMENDTYPSIFSEKITDCFATGTIPVFWGTPDIGTWFNTDGIITLTEDFRFETLSKDLYESKRDAIVDNFERTMKLVTAEDYIYLHYLKPLFESEQTRYQAQGPALL